MTKTILLTGKALEIASAIDKNTRDTHGELDRLKEQAKAVADAGQKNSDDLHSQLKAALSLDEEDCCHVDTEYLREHGQAYVRTACQRSGGIGDMITEAMGLKQREPDGNGGLH